MADGFGEFRWRAVRTAIRCGPGGWVRTVTVFMVFVCVGIVRVTKNWEARATRVSVFRRERGAWW